MAAAPVVTVVLDESGVLTTTTDLVKAAPLIQDFAAKAKLGFSLPAILKLIEDVATDLPVIIADVEAVFASSPAPTAKP